MIDLDDKIEDIKDSIYDVENREKRIDRRIRGQKHTRSREEYRKRFQLLIKDEDDIINDLQEVEQKFIGLLNQDTEQLIQHTERIIQWEEDVCKALESIEEEKELTQIKDQLEELENEKRKIESTITNKELNNSIEFLLNTDTALLLFEELQKAIDQTNFQHQKIEALAPRIKDEKYQKQIFSEKEKLERVIKNIEELENHIYHIEELSKRQEELHKGLKQLPSLKSEIEKVRQEVEQEEQPRPDLQETLQLLFHINQQLTDSAREILKEENQDHDDKNLLDILENIKLYRNIRGNFEGNSKTLGIDEIGKEGLKLQYRAYKLKKESDIKIDYIIENERDKSTQYEFITHMSSNLGIIETRNIDEGGGGLYGTTKTIQPGEKHRIGFKIRKITDGEAAFRNMLQLFEAPDDLELYFKISEGLNKVKTKRKE